MAGRWVKPSAVRWLGGLLVGVAAVAAVSGVIALVEPHTPAVSLLVLYILPVLAVAVVWGTGLAVVTAVLSTAFYAYLFAPPIHSIRVGESGDLTALGVFVDDSPGFVAAARSLLERQGLRILGVASNCAEGLRLVAELRPDVVLVDIDLGAESGFELARRLDQMQDSAPTPVILISTHSEQDYADLIADSPALGFLSKTVISATAIRSLLGRGPDPVSPISGLPGR